jgi:hypothetical protein
MTTGACGFGPLRSQPQFVDPGNFPVKHLLLGKDADPDIPILKQAKAEYAKLQ